METRIINAIQAYEIRYEHCSGNEAAFYMPDIFQIMKVSGVEDINSISINALIRIAHNALKAGFMIGYRKAQRDNRKKVKKA